jgi:hypothetical protein
VRNLLEWSVFIAKLLVVWAAIETIAGPTDPNLGLLTSLLLLHGFSWLTGLMVKITCCDKPVPPAEPVATAKPSAASDGDHSNGIGPNGGVVFDLGEYRAEFRVDHPKSECAILIVTGDKTDAKPLPIAAKELILTTKETKTADGKVVPPMTVKLLPVDESNGRAARFVGTDPGISNVADFAGTVLGEVDGKSSQGDFTEQIASAGLSTRSPWLNPRCTNCRGEAKE